MAETVLVLHEQQTGVVAADGTCIITLRPTLQHEEWSNIYVSIGNGGALVPQCRVYNGAPVPANYLQGSQHATGDGASLEDVVLRVGHFLTLVWSGATPGSICNATVDGTRTLRGVKVAY